MEPIAASIIEWARKKLEEIRASGNREHARWLYEGLNNLIEIANSCSNPVLVEELQRELLSLRDEARELID
jgi:hypothetical protein